ncbi:hypothetical protein O6H91_15G006100 [Diphasiastrum complanatum]|uniref:Uncharacterized protein n=1 Tax=Diphasiastrum complanatum TaxID=34168 RepID=A0ACC2BFM8_DIPCM|nr:hypothetical protein O6H91_15G006100 [Diphasiastrum complanatum]
MTEEKFNLRNPAVKRILQEVKEMQNNPSDEYLSMPLEDNIFEWHFAIRGPQDSEFEGGIYHGRIQLPSEYPFKPPAFMLLTPNGRFETQTKICLSISQHHPEHWQPSWSVRTALVALIAFMPTKPDGALGSLDYAKEERRALAIKSRDAPPKSGNADRQMLIDEIHEQMMRTAPPVPDITSQPPAAVSDSNSQDVDNNSMNYGESAPQVVDNIHELHVNANAGPIAVSFTAGFSLSTRAPAAQQEPNLAAVARAAPPIETQPAVVIHQQPSEDRGLTLLAIGLTVAILALVVKKILKSYGWIDA